MNTPAPLPPLDLRPVQFRTPLRSLEGAVAIETDDGTVTVLEVGPTKVRLTMQNSTDPVYILGGDLDQELGDFALLRLPKHPVRAFALPAGSMQHNHLPTIVLSTVLFAVVAVTAIPFLLLTPLPAQAQAFLATALIALAIVGPILRSRVRPAVRQAFRTAAGNYPLDRLLDSRPRALEAARSVDEIKERYGELLSDICYRIENPALFDPVVPATNALTTALIRWESRRPDLEAAEIGTLAAEVRVAFETAQANAEAVGMTHIPSASRPPAERALKAARLARSTRSPAEREAALRQVSGILADLALYYLPNPTEATLMVEGRRILALPGRIETAGEES